MEKEPILVVGLGEVGRAIYDIIKERGFNVFGYDLDEKKSIHALESVPKKVKVMHICFPMFDKETFIKECIKYMNRFNPELTVIESTVIPGTTREIYEKTKKQIVHSPIRGKHPNLQRHIKFWTKWIGSPTKEAALKAKEYYEKIGLKVIVAENSETTELAKLIETVYRALLIAWWQEVHRMSKIFGSNIMEICKFVLEVHEVLKDRPVYYPAVIRGHCLIPNTRLLLNALKENNFLKFILTSNEKRAEELKNERLMKEVEEIKKEIWKKYTPQWYYE